MCAPTANRSKTAAIAAIPELNAIACASSSSPTTVSNACQVGVPSSREILPLTAEQERRGRDQWLVQRCTLTRRASRDDRLRLQVSRHDLCTITTCAEMPDLSGRKRHL